MSDKNLIYIYNYDNLYNHIVDLSIEEMEIDCILGCKELNILKNIKFYKNEKTCLYLYYWKGMKQTDISKFLSIPLRTVVYKIRQAKIKIAKYFEIDLNKKDIRLQFKNLRKKYANKTSKSM